jgi:hypothetical protein
MSSDAKRVVWILGSGFSRSLGGPLLGDLLSHRGEAYVKTKFPKIDRRVYHLYRAHLRDAPESAGHPIYWDHAEEFLDFLNTATVDGGRDRYNILVDLLYPVPKKMLKRPTAKTDLLREMRADATRCIAAECLFTTHANPASEAWGPYVRWGKALGENDTIITFNYDMVLEKLARFEPRVRFSAETVVNPTRAEAIDDSESGAAPVPILKLHGSVSWLDMGRAFAHSYVDESAASSLAGGDVPLIATPGPEKQSRQKGLLKPIWDRAEAALEAADVIVFLGYRFPPSDSQARTTLVEAMKRVPLDKYVRVHTVLGPNTAHEDTVRLSRLIGHTLEDAGRYPADTNNRFQGKADQFHIVFHALYVEDFLSVFHTRMLNGINLA